MAQVEVVVVRGKLLLLQCITIEIDHDVKRRRRVRTIPTTGGKTFMHEENLSMLGTFRAHGAAESLRFRLHDK